MRSSRGEEGGKELLPQAEGSQEEECQIEEGDKKCFIAGQYFLSTETERDGVCCRRQPE